MSRGRSAFLVSVLASVVLSAAAGTGSAARPGLLLPDLRQLAPGPPRVIASSDGRLHVGFTSSVANVGTGPLVVVGERTESGLMRADQVVRSPDSGAARFRNIGSLRYTRGGGHAHWHFLPFETYELAQLGKDSVTLRGRKAGFCLGDGFQARVRPPLAAKPPHPVFKTSCGRGAPELLRLVQGISVGYGDKYGAGLAGQSFDVTGLPEGEYLVVHRVNRGRRLRERSYANNVGALRMRLEWPRGPDERPRVIPIRRCSGSLACGRRGE